MRKTHINAKAKPFIKKNKSSYLIMNSKYQDELLGTIFMLHFKILLHLNFMKMTKKRYANRKIESSIVAHIVLNRKFDLLFFLFRKNYDVKIHFD